ncbi:hypothetical protein [Mesobacillus subterraneus]|uniref:hypothetical protein n=1 Tax=Mesobacillus subterraneus TaxID=285983 RepID=UPI001FE4C907|nr:hypothetical protein [Mesobacillus subterraneus]
MKKECLIGPLGSYQRRMKAYDLRLQAAKRMKTSIARHRCNGDEELFETKIGSYT